MGLSRDYRGNDLLMRGAIGDIVAAGAAHLALELLEECSAVAASAGFAPQSEFLERTRHTVTTPGSSLTASMPRDIERGARIEAEHILGDLVRRGSRVLSADHSLLRLVNMLLKAYEARRKRAQTAAAGVSS